jgi:hypothetical protein
MTLPSSRTARSSCCCTDPRPNHPPAAIRRSKVAISLREMSSTPRSLNHPRTPKALPASASLSLISLREMATLLARPSLPLDGIQSRKPPSPKILADTGCSIQLLPDRSALEPATGSDQAKQSGHLAPRDELNAPQLYHPRTPKALPASASLSLISAERDGYSAGAVLVAS